ncbi:3-dehydroquinate synthase [uncultured Actinomyces sp.]|uniref:3-dehydroquinate synthase n=1 Tax=uncultured Actinomyces sp. TaxID=249061 RepID=UPI0028DCC473|nr:3-dehydroquinate synthase [uncultured Actinomyces sp.]
MSRYPYRKPRVSVAAEHLPLVLVGLPGAGKTTVARLLATALGVQVTDTDAEIRRRARLTIPQIFDAEGEEGFRDREEQAMRAVLTSPQHAQGVLALGGGAVLRPANRALLAGRTVVYLLAAPATAARHVGDGSGRPLMAGRCAGADSDTAEAASQGAQDTAAGVLARMETLYRQRAPLYAAVATHTVPTDGLSPEQVAALVLVTLGAEPGRAASALAVATGRTRPSPAGSAARPPAVPPAGPGTDRVPTLDDHPRELDRLRGGQTVRLPVGGAWPYEVLIGRDLGAQVTCAVTRARGGGAGGVAVVHPPVLRGAAEHHEALLEGLGLRATRIEVPAGEACKTVGVLEEVWEALGRFRMGRDGCVVGLGGGATTDLAGLAAATWLRGVPVVQVPTTLLAMVDAAVGGKTGIDTAAGKNLVGAFHPPAGVVCDLATLDTLPLPELRAGAGEVVKCGLIADPVVLEQVLADPDVLAAGSPALAELVARAVAVKAAVVGRDLTESGLREILNYGHTYAHAVEKVTGYRWRHGEAVAVGCVYAAEVSHRLGRLDAAALDLHRRAMVAVGLPVSFPQGAGCWEELHAAMMSDKKVRSGRLRLVLLDAVARPVRLDAPGEELLRAAHEAVSRP